MNDFFNEALWEKAWKDHGDTIVNKLNKAGIAPAKAFDHKAKSFNEQSFNEEGKKRTTRIINWLEGLPLVELLGENTAKFIENNVA